MLMGLLRVTIAISYSAFSCNPFDDPFGNSIGHAMDNFTELLVVLNKFQNEYIYI